MNHFLIWSLCWFRPELRIGQAGERNRWLEPGKKRVDGIRIINSLNPNPAMVITPERSFQLHFTVPL